MEHLAQPPAGSRGNGLDAGGWTRVIDCDPRLTDELLSLLADADIAACAAPSPGERGAYLELRPASRPVDRLYVDSTRRSDALKLVRGRLDRPIGELTERASMSAQDEAFEAIVAGFGDVPTGISWPDAENVSAEPRVVKPAQKPTQQNPGLLDPGGLLYDSTIGEGNASGDPFEDDENHYAPPPAPPAPTWKAATKAAVAAIAVGVLFFVAVGCGLVTDDTLAIAAGAVLVLGGLGSLVLHMGDEPRDDDGTRV